MLVAVGMTLLMIEDAGNPSTRFAWYLTVVLGADRQVYFIGRMVFFLGLAAVVLYPFIQHREHVWVARSTRRYHLAGFVAYGLAAFGSLPANAFRGCERIGDLLARDLFREASDPAV